MIMKRGGTSGKRLFENIVMALILALLLTSGCAKVRVSSFPDIRIRIESMENTVRYLSGIKPSRNFENPESMGIAAIYISRKLEEYGLSPKKQEFTVLGKTFANIIASVGPPEGARLIVGAHYDVFGNQPGADDNASGVAGLLEIARVAKSYESFLKFGVDFVAYALEEPPFFDTPSMGSYVHAEFLHKNGVKVKGMICLEMIGFFTAENGSQSYPLAILRPFYPSMGNFIGVVSNLGSSSFADRLSRYLKATSVDVRVLKAPAFVEGVDFSDHLNYWKFGYDAVMITDTAFFRNPNYHKDTDTIETLDFRKMNEVVKGLCWSILNMN